MLIIKLIAPTLRIKKDDEFYFNWGARIIAIPEKFESDKNFVRHCIEEHGCANAEKYEYALSILHEIGHWKTRDFYEDNIDDEQETRAYLSLLDYDKIYDDYNIVKQYFDLPVEFAATEWAVRFLKKHKIISKIFQKSVDK